MSDQRIQATTVDDREHECQYVYCRGMEKEEFYLEREILQEWVPGGQDGWERMTHPNSEHRLKTPHE